MVLPVILGEGNGILPIPYTHAPAFGHIHLDKFAIWINISNMWINMWIIISNMWGVTCNPEGGEIGSSIHLAHVKQISGTNMQNKYVKQIYQTNISNKHLKQIYMKQICVILGEGKWDSPYLTCMLIELIAQTLWE